MSEEIDYDYVTEEMFQEKLEEIVCRATTDQLLAIPGVYELLREALNNDVLSELDMDHSKNDHADSSDDEGE